MSSFHRNVAANLFGTGWVALIQVVVAPILIWKLGVGAYALISFYVALIAILAILDLGFSPTITRSMAQILSTDNPSATRSSVLRTFELVFFGVSSVVGGGIAIMAPLIAHSWLKSSILTGTQIETAVELMGLLFFLRWPLAPYIATLQGLQQQVQLSIANAAMYTVVNLGAIAMLWVIAPTVHVFFISQCVGGLLQLLLLRVLAWRAILPRGIAPHFNFAVIRNSWRFSAGMMGISFTAIVLTQSDKLILSKLFILEEYGYYAVAQVLAAGLYVVISPIFNAVFPRFCELVATRDELELKSFYQFSSSLMSAILIPTAAFLILFSDELMLLWTRNADVAWHAAPLFKLLILGTALNGLMNLPYALQLARGNTKIGLIINSVLCAVLFPSILLLTLNFGLVGGASVSLILNGLYLLIGLPVTYKICLDSNNWTDFYHDLLTNRGLSVFFLLVVRACLPNGWDSIGLSLLLLVSFTLSLALSIALLPGARSRLSAFLSRQ